jgi:predicted RNA-binding Zn-ribbon protein involved in translation (DUF1610 family)
VRIHICEHCGVRLRVQPWVFIATCPACGKAVAIPERVRPKKEVTP